MNPDLFITVGATVLSGGFAAWGARSARRTKRQEKRDDFAAVTDRMDREIVRQGQQINELKAESLRQGEQITDQALAIQWLQGRLREVISFFRTAGPVPPASDPIPERAKKYIHHIDA